jgi:hypothetical protein
MELTATITICWCPTINQESVYLHEMCGDMYIHKMLLEPQNDWYNWNMAIEENTNV